MERGELAEESDQGTLAEAVVDVGVESWMKLDNGKMSLDEVTYREWGIPCSNVGPRQPVVMSAPIYLVKITNMIEECAKHY